MKVVYKGEQKKNEKSASYYLMQEWSKTHNAQGVWSGFLDFCLDIFDVKHYANDDFERNAEAMMKKNPNYAAAMVVVMNDITESIESVRLTDPLGRLHEELFQSRGNASHLGQYFTPESLCQLMTKCTWTEKDNNSVYDCSCGSGRTLIAHRLESLAQCKFYPAEYVGEDIDITSVKMCALNLMWYGCRGRVSHCDTLLMKYFWTEYVINEVRYPIQTPFYSVRKVMHGEEVGTRPNAQKAANSVKNAPSCAANEQLQLF